MDILIMDDDKRFIKTLKKDFTEYFKNDLEEMNIICVDNSFDQYNPQKLDIAFIDIELKECTGFSIAEKLKDKLPELIIIFVSHHDGLVCKTLKLGILQFIRKSYYLEDSIFAFRHLKEHLERELKKSVLIINGRHVLIEARKISYLLSIGREVSIHTDEDEYILKSSMQGVLDVLNFKTLVKIQKNVVINMMNIKSMIRDEIVMEDNQKWRIGRVYRKEVVKKYHQFLLKVMKF